MPTAATEIRSLLVRLCNEQNVQAPAPEQALTAWLDEVLAQPLAPKGGPAWQRGQSLLIDAFEGAAALNEKLAREFLRQVADVVRTEARRACACARPLAATDDGFGRKRCAVCRGKVAA